MFVRLLTSASGAKRIKRLNARTKTQLIKTHYGKSNNEKNNMKNSKNKNKYQ